VKMDEENRALTSVVDGQLGYLLLRFLPSSRGQVRLCCNVKFPLIISPGNSWA
jgi:hypothetical protein